MYAYIKLYIYLSSSAWYLDWTSGVFGHFRCDKIGIAQVQFWNHAF